MMKRSVIQTMFNAYPELKYKTQLNLESNMNPCTHYLISHLQKMDNI